MGNLFRYASGLATLLAAPLALAAGGQDLRLTYRSPADGSEQAYRLYVPSTHRADQPAPLVVALHGSGGNENSFFDDEAHYPARDGLKSAVEKFGVLAVCPTARGNTNYRGLGENSVFAVLADVRKRYRIDEDRIYLTGHSMGGTGATDLALHHPGIFAAVVPLAAARSIRWVAANAQHTPFWWIGGALDQEFYKLGVAVGYERMKRLGYAPRFTELPGAGHYETARDFHPVIAWLVQHRRVAHPREFTFEVDTPLHPRAYWITVDAIAAAGKIAVVRATAGENNSARLALENVAAVSVWPDPAIFDLARPVRISIGEAQVFSGQMSPEQEVALSQATGTWRARVQPRREISLTGFRDHPVAVAREALALDGTEARLGNWIADAMRLATGVDLALYNHRTTAADRPLPAGKVDIVDLLQCSLPGDQDLVIVDLKGSDLVEILDANIPARETAGGFAANGLVQLSGAAYTFDHRLPAGERIVTTTIDPARTYSVVLEGQVVERETMRLAGRFKQLKYRTTDTPFTLALYGHAARTPELHAPVEGRVREEP